MNRAFIPLTEAQREKLRPMFLAIARRGGAVMAQIFQDGMHVVALPDEVAVRVSEATGVDYLPKIRNGFQAFLDGVDRDRKGGAE